MSQLVHSDLASVEIVTVSDAGPSDALFEDDVSHTVLSSDDDCDAEDSVPLALARVRRRFAADFLAPPVGASARSSSLMTVVFSGAGTMAHLGHAYSSNNDHPDFAFDRPDGFAGDFARLCTIVNRSNAIHITLNVVLPSRDEHGNEYFPNTCLLHGTIPDNTVPAPEATDKYVEAALALIPAEVRLHVVFIGVGMTRRNGKGVPAFLRALADRVDVVSVYDEREIDGRRLDYLRNPAVGKCGLCRAEIYQTVGRIRDVHDGLLHQTPRVTAAPTAAELRAAYERCEWPATTDQVVLDLHTKLVKSNGVVKTPGATGEARQSKRPRRASCKVRGEEWGR